jgi:hypothetical protein
MLVYGIERLALPWYYSKQGTEQWDGLGIY